jgi:hypothetical protein
MERLSIRESVDLLLGVVQEIERGVRGRGAQPGVLADLSVIGE